MQHLLFFCGETAYAINCHFVKEVLPFVLLTEIANSPHFVKGVMNYHGDPVFVIDFSILTLNRPSELLLSSRIALISQEKEELSFGIFGEKMTEIIDIPEFEIKIDENCESAFIESMALTSGKKVQIINIKKLSTLLTLNLT
ncbi:chemotaxis protein CheW [Criblamydia sequanensis]|uniref:Chemotaxis signal transduction protein n=1 Tax=Candidatus Criblamydia sequanensis CRIB-18 TaxID=1437425 RepID=A0A090CYY3_9BACT|nr:chemotaxis protein CheW [Criblamydia sequanensis]CDR33831.1 Chemotaxis signal transduction protein [Criblamydia sequanensis CRIB-18]